jgi:7-cyano-7-deazaguanine synthase
LKFDNEMHLTLPSSAVVLHSGGMDSSICLKLAVDRFGKERVISFGFDYNQRHRHELEAAQTIADFIGVRRLVMNLPHIFGWEDSSLVEKKLEISTLGKMPNSFVPGRNGLFAMLSAPLIKKVEASMLYMGVMELEGANSGYPDCSRAYIDLVESLIRIDIASPSFSIQTPLIGMTKEETMQVASDHGILPFLLEHSVTCYEGIAKEGCGKCPACRLREEGLRKYIIKTGQKRGEGL